jgi:hypothetical protein
MVTLKIFGTVKGTSNNHLFARKKVKHFVSDISNGGLTVSPLAKDEKLLVTRFNRLKDIA